MRFGVDDLTFSTSYWYDDAVDLRALTRRHGEAVMRNLIFHAVAFEASKLASFAPRFIDFGPYRELASVPFWAAWSTVWRNVWSQWRYENDALDYPGPAPLHELSSGGPEPARVDEPSDRPLLFVGGGKDSLVAMRLLDEAGIAYDTYGYSHSVYGRSQLQHDLLTALTRHGTGARRHLRHWVFDDLLDSPVVELRPDLGTRTLAAAETPSSVFGVLPVLLALGATTPIVAHERSAERGSVVWEPTGEEINHQWGKTLAAERLLGDYIRTHLVSGTDYTSVLKPIHDPTIFTGLRGRPAAIADTHSCGVRKPWCEECAKCAYVWVNYLAFLGAAAARGSFRTEVAASPRAERHFRHMLGLDGHRPFDCVGTVAETRLAFQLAARDGARGGAFDLYRSRVAPLTPREVAPLFHVGDDHTMPAPLAARVLPLLRAWAGEGLADANTRLFG